MSRHKRPEVDTRLSKIEGHVRAIRKMVHENRSYPEIVHQVAAVRASLDGVLEVIVDDLVEDCLASAKKGTSVGDTVLELQQVVASIR
ncbi:MAG TPA: metal-sensitive transcriptional regulator [Candidatus Bathyarchaeia archaeon]|nr:metal-sensitive transcriptional regulator [Candidatus Bathyarchaeia archaeon]